MDKILHQLMGSLSHYLQGFIHTRRCRISSITSSTLKHLYGMIWPASTNGATLNDVSCEKRFSVFCLCISLLCTHITAEPLTILRSLSLPGDLCVCVLGHQIPYLQKRLKFLEKNPIPICFLFVCCYFLSKKMMLNLLIIIFFIKIPDSQSAIHSSTKSAGK